jgi:DNA (cytosine-5)-methyltransferase 1
MVVIVSTIIRGLCMGQSMGGDIRYISLFSGVEACSVAWYHMKNWKAQVFAEFDEFPSAVLAHQFPHVPNVGDVTKHDWKQYREKIELVVGGSPCQSFSAAGKRLGLDDPRGNLALHFLRVIDDIRPTWFIFENVPGLLSSDNGRDFATFLREVENIGYGCAYRVLDAQYFGVPQRRRRVFVVGHIDGDWRRAAAVLFEPGGLSRDSPTSRKAEQAATSNTDEGIRERGEYWNGERIANTLTARADGQRMPDKDHFNGVVVPNVVGTLDTDINQKLNHQSAKAGHLLPVAIDLYNQEETGEVHAPLRTAQGHGAPAVMYENHPSDSRIKEVDVAPTMTAKYGTGGGNVPLIKQTIPIHDQATRHSGKRGDRQDGKGNGLGIGKNGDPSNTLTRNDRHAVMADLVVRRLTPTECERLQGFPDGWTKIPWKGKPKEQCPDGHRFKAMGNSMAVPVMRWIGEGIELVNRIPREGQAPQQEELGWL